MYKFMHIYIYMEKDMNMNYMNMNYMNMNYMNINSTNTMNKERADTDMNMFFSPLYVYCLYKILMYITYVFTESSDNGDIS
jgi:hypothetical protein